MTQPNEDIRRDEEPTFEEPWQARAFAIAVSLTDRGDGDLPWGDFQTRLVEEIEADDRTGTSEEIYYEQWLSALERLLVEHGIIESGDLTARAMEFDRGERDASEFVIGDRDHAHDHDHDHPH